MGIIKRALERLEHDGWNQGGFYDGKRLCVDGALCMVALNDVDPSLQPCEAFEEQALLAAPFATTLRERTTYDKARLLVEEALDDWLGEQGLRISTGFVYWQDAAERTFDDVKHLLTVAAEREDAA